MSEKIKKPLTKGAKNCIIIGIIFAIVFSILGGALIYLTVNQNAAYSKIVIACMPKTITGEDNNKKIDFHVEFNKDYDKKKDAPLKAYKIYYMDGDKRVDLPDGHYKSRTADMQVLIGFFTMAQKNIKTMKHVIIGVIVGIGVLFVAYLIYIWYLLWRNKQIKKQENSKLYNQKAYLNDFEENK